MRWAHTRDDTHTTVAIAALLAVTTLVSGCTTFHRPTRGPAPSASIPVPTMQPESPAFVRYGRYTLREVAPEAAQQDLMLQIIDITMPATMSATVGEALRYVLLRSGYQLCEDREEAHALEALPLPATHLHLGPLTLREALQVLAGPAWQLEIDDLARRVCFTTRPHVVSEASTSVASHALDDAVQVTQPAPSTRDSQP